MFEALWTPAIMSLTDLSVAIIGTISSCTLLLTSSIASTFVGSTIATKSLPSRRAIGITLFVFAMSRGTKDMISDGTRNFDRLIKGVLRQRPMLTVMS